MLDSVRHIVSDVAKMGSQFAGAGKSFASAKQGWDDRNKTTAHLVVRPK